MHVPLLMHGHILAIYLCDINDYECCVYSMFCDVVISSFSSFAIDSFRKRNMVDCFVLAVVLVACSVFLPRKAYFGLQSVIVTFYCILRDSHYTFIYIYLL